MAWFDVDGFLATVTTRGVPDAQLPLYREAATALLDGAPTGRFSQRMLDDALARIRDDGASERRVTNLRTVGVAMVEFAGAGAATIGGPAPAPLPPLPLELEFLDERATIVGRPPRLEAPPPPTAFAPPSVFAPPSPPAPSPAAFAVVPMAAMVPMVPIAAPTPAAAAPIVDLSRPREAPPPLELAHPVGPRTASAVAPRDQLRRTDDGPPPLPGCACKARRDVYLDDHWQSAGNVFLGFSAVAGFSMWALGPPYLGGTITSGLVVCGALVAAISVGFRCEHCRGWIRSRAYTADQRRAALLRRLIFLGVAGVAALVCAASMARLRDAIG